MERDWRDFKSLKGGIEGAREEFEKACETLIREIHPNKNVQQVRVKLGDGGIDIYVGELGIEPITVYQCKFFLEEFDSAQHAQIRNSFKTANTSDKFELKNWVLCIPKILDIDESVWWTKWKNKTTKLNNKDTQYISLINGNELIDLMKAYGVYASIFEIEQITLTREIHGHVTQLVEAFNPNKYGLPRIKWSTYIGKQKWKNTPLVLGNSIFVGSAGNKWNEPDDNDGIYHISADSGEILWMHRTNSDVNEVSFYDGLIIGGCDDGSVHCLSSKNGNVKWQAQLGSGVVSKIFKYAGYNEETLVVTCYSGIIYFLNLLDGTVLQEIQLDGNIMSNILFIDDPSNKTIFVTTLEGKLYELTEDFDHFKITSETILFYPDIYNEETGYSRAELYSTPLVHDSKIYIGYTRQTYYEYPAIQCLDANTKETLWHANDPNGVSRHYGNIRTSLLYDENQIVFTHPYSNELVGLNSKNGEVIWATNLGREMFQQWSSPISTNSNYYLARYDGYLYKIDKQTKKRDWGLYLGESDDAGVIFDKTQEVANKNENAAWELFKGFSLISTPSIMHNSLIIGSDEGILYCIECVQ